MKLYKILIVLLFLIPSIVFADASYDVNIYFFHSDTCPHCKNEDVLLKKIEKRYSNVKIYRIEVHDEDNRIIYDQVKRLYKIDNDIVPITIIGDRLYQGFNEKKYTTKFIKTIEYYSIYPYEDRVLEVIDHNYDRTPVSKQDITLLDDFLLNYKNYSLYGIKTDKLDTTTVSLMLGLVSSTNIISIISVVVVLFVLTRVASRRDKVLLLVAYFVNLGLLRICSILRNHYVMLILYMIVKVIL